MSFASLAAQTLQERFQNSIQVQRLKAGKWHNYTLPKQQKKSELVRSLERTQMAVRYNTATAKTNGSTFIAFMDANKTWENKKKLYGFYQLQPGGNSYTLLHETPNIDMNGGCAIYDGKFHGTSWDQTYTGTYHEYNIIDWTPTENDGTKVYNYNYWASSSAYDPVEGKVYLVGLDNDTFEYTLVRVDFNTFEDGTIIKHLGDYAYAAMAFDAEGQLWAISAKGVLMKVDKKTGVETVVGNTGVKPGVSWGSAAFDNKTGKLYWAANEYDTNVSHLYEVDTTTGKATAVSNYDNEEVFPFLYIEAAADDTAPADLSDLAVTFNEASTTGTVNFTMPAKTYGGQALNGNVSYSISIDGTEVKTGSAKAGAKVSEEVSTSEGQHIIAVVLTANGKKGSTNKLQKWVGNDNPAAVGNPTLNIDNNGKALVSWTAPTRGAHDGYIGTLTFSIYNADGSLLAKNISGTEYTIQLDKQKPYDAFYYYVVAFNGKKRGENTVTPYACFGQPLTAPYASDFSTVSGAYTYEIVDNDNNDVTWGYDADTKSLIYFSMYTNYDATPDDWVVTPPFTLKADRQYSLSYDARCYSESDREVLRLYMADGNVEDVKDFKPMTADNDTIHTIVFKPVEHTVTVSEDGTYRFGIRAMENTGLAVYVRNIKFTEGCMLAAPDSVSDITVAPDKRGELKATLSFKAPSKTISGKALSSISKIEVFEQGNATAVATVNNPQPGKTCTVNVTAASTGNTTYRIVASNGEGQGLTTTVSAYIGEDTPLAPKNIRLVDNLDGTCKLTWDAPGSTGIHGGYVNPDNVTYEIYSVTDNTPSLLKANVKGNEYGLGAFDQENRIQRLFYYAMKAVDGDNKSEYGVSTSLLSGAPYNLPFEESWANGMQKYYWATNSIAGNYYFDWFTQLSADNDKGCAYYGSNQANAGDCAVLSSGKISLVGSANPRLSFSYYLISNGAHKIDVIVKTAHGTSETVKTIDYNKEALSGAKEGWKEEVIDLGQFKDEKYITVNFKATIGNPKALVLLDNCRVRDVYEYDLSATISGPEVVTSGTKAHYDVTVSNEGSNPMSNYSVGLYINGKLVDNKTVDEALAVNAKNTVGFDYNVPATANGTLNVKATVSHDFDMDEENNASKEISNKVVAPSFPSVDDLKASTDGNGVKLNWSSAAGKRHSVTDNFEQYTAWAIDDLGQWTLVDGDKNYTYGYGNTFPNQGTPFAYIVFNPSAAGDNGNNLDPHSGDQYLASFSSSTKASDDWLISPELSGEKQTISFWVKTVNDEYGKEEYEVLYSTTDKDTKSFQTIKAKTEASTAWTEIKVELPSGAKYFAIRCVSNDHTMFALDDVSYEAPAMTPVGYKVYKNGECVATLNAESTSFNDADGTKNDSYFITVVYAEGESTASNVVSSGTTGITTLNATEQGYKILYEVTNNVYIVKKNGRTYKVIMKK